MELTLENIEALIKMAVKNKLDHLEVGELKITKTRYESTKQESSTTNKTSNNSSELDEVLFWSTSSPTLTQEQIEALAQNQVLPPGTKSRKNKGS